jgi:hypothetical protein
MVTKWKTLGLVALIAAGASPAAAQTTPITQLNCTSGNWPNCGWSSVGTTPYSSKTLVPTGGPQGQPAIQFDQLGSGTHAQYYLGWSTNVGTPGQGSTRYLRLRFKGLSPVRMAGNDGSWGNKFIIIGDGDNPTGRVMCILRDNGQNDTTMAIQCQRNIDGDPNRTQLMTLSPDVWHSLQLELKSSTTTSSGDGHLRLWIDGANSNYSAPTSQSGAFQLNAINWGNLNVGYYAGTTISTGSHVAYQVADIQYDDAFDAGYHSGTGGPPPPTPPVPPSNVHVIPASLDILMLAALAGTAAFGFLRPRRRA